MNNLLIPSNRKYFEERLYFTERVFFHVCPSFLWLAYCLGHYVFHLTLTNLGLIFKLDHEATWLTGLFPWTVSLSLGQNFRFLWFKPHWNFYRGNNRQIDLQGGTDDVLSCRCCRLTLHYHGAGLIWLLMTNLNAWPQPPLSQRHNLTLHSYVKPTEIGKDISISPMKHCNVVLCQNS